jgi:hypothetical protein
MNANIIPSLIAFAPALLLPLVQEVIRPRVAHTGVLGFVLSWAPNFVIAVCFPFSILIRPRAWTSRHAVTLFYVWSMITLAVLVLFELYDPLGPQTFDRADIAASVAGVALALALFHGLVRARLTFGDAQPSRTTSPRGRS